MVSPTDGWAVGAQGAILRWNGSVWSQVDSPATDPLTSVVVVSASDAWAVGGGYDWGVSREYAIILHWDGNTWTQTARFDYFLLNAVDIVASDDVWAVGTSGRILHWDGSAWRYVPSSTGFPLTSISMVSATEGWVAGFRGRLVHWNGSAWTELSFPGIDAIRSVSTAGHREAWAITMSAIWRWNGSTWLQAAGTGIDAVHIYLDGPYGTGTIIGGATYGLERPDFAAQYGARFRPSGWELSWDTGSVPPGVHQLYLYAHRTTDNAWSLLEPHLVVIRGGHLIWLPLASKH